MSRSDTSPSRSSDPGVDEAPILHVDLDAFFASVEVLDDPSLRGRPVAVGGSGDRGVIASASYEARCFGVYSAMPTVMARRVCPELIILPGRFDRYGEYSTKFQAIVEDLTPQYEPLGLDEVFADLRSLRRLDVRPIAAAHALRARINDELSLTSGVGIGSNKLFAKLASKRAKPRVIDGVLHEGPGVFYVDEATRAQWLDELPVRALWGVGPATSTRLERLGLSTVRELAKVDESTLRSHFGRAMAHSLHEMSHGRDAREVTAHRATKSIGHMETFAVSVVGEAELLGHLRRHAEVVARALRSSGQVAHTISITVRYDDLSSIGRSQSVDFGLDDDAAVTTIARALLETVPLNAPVRLFGVSASGLRAKSGSEVQLSFDVASTGSSESTARTQQATRAALSDAIDDLRRRFGRSVIGLGTDLVEGEIEIAQQRGRHPFGPEADIQRP